MKNFIKENKIFLLFAYISICFIFAGRWAIFKYSLMTARMVAVLLYLPFMLLIGWKFICDIKYPEKNILNFLYYLFSLYYVVLSAFRLAFGLEVKENFYYTLLLLGSLSIFLQIKNQRIKIKPAEFAENFAKVYVYITLYAFVCKILVSNGILYTALINSSITTFMIVLLLPVVLNHICEKAKKNDNYFFYYLGLCAGIVMIFTSGSRALFFLAIVTVVCLLISNIKEKKNFKILLTNVGCAVLIVGLLAQFNIGNTRYALHRECGYLINVTTSLLSKVALPPSSNTDSPTPPSNMDKESSQSQIVRSDSGRRYAMQFGLDQVRKNPWFGTGDVLFDWTTELGYTVQQTAHNFLIETLSCYGIVGTLPIVAFFLCILIQMAPFSKRNKKLQRYTVSLFLCVFCLLAEGSVQMVVYNHSVAPLFLLILSYHDCIFLQPVNEAV